METTYVNSRAKHTGTHQGKKSMLSLHAVNLVKPMQSSRQGENFND